MALRVLVTGANGFVGKQICQTLQLKGWNVRAMVRSSKASDQIPTEMQRVVVDTAAADIDWQAALDQVDAVVHLIAKTHSRDHNSPKARESYHRTNVELTESLLAACQKSNVRRFLYMSSIKAVGEGGGAEYTEDTRCAPGDIYGITKRIAEKAVWKASESATFDAVVLRPPLIYGPGVQGNFLRLMQAIDRGLPLPLGSVRNARSMVSVVNLADATAACLQSDSAGRQVFHVADETPLSTRVLTEQIAGHLHCRARLIPVPVRLLRLAGNVLGVSETVHRLSGDLRVSTRKIQTLLGWAPPVTAEAGIKATVEHYLAGSSATVVPNSKAA